MRKQALHTALPVLRDFVSFYAAHFVTNINNFNKNFILRRNSIKK